MIHAAQRYPCRVLPLSLLPALVPMLPSWMDPATIIHALGNGALWGVCAILFIECAIFPILPGDSLLFTVGMFIAMVPPSITFGDMGKPMVYVVACLIMTVFAVGGNMAGYYIGKFVSGWLFKPRDGWVGKIFSQKHLDDTHKFFARYGSKALVLGRFVPFVRTFVTMVAGAAGMTFRHFILWTAVGGVLWVWGVTALGYFLGNVAFIGDNIDLVLVAIVLISVIPMVVEYLLEKRRGRMEAAAGADA
ncbi:SNARE associated protein [Propionibacterium freudenreichii]|nr:SNARE-like domain protein [Propionibacterium freudenreichii subsp. freudenreichii]AWY95129.1 SNARE associated protein [Propionibacterium freudenreichii]CUW19142.1 SNARE-like domain protein [Propionibacterium freudenreichii subsp. shermanii]SBM42591.1 SNARE associated protein [Propionibacterium freudenreichii]SBN41837.1 SNARE associated protein [Propionibacterium freudenreichii]